jgi:hypothetical protein
MGIFVNFVVIAHLLPHAKKMKRLKKDTGNVEMDNIVNPRIFAYTDDMDNATLIRFLDYLASRDTSFYAKARKFRKENGLAVDPGD